MGRDDEGRPEPQAQGKGRIDEVDQSKGIFRLDGPHPKDAELRAPGTLGGLTSPARVMRVRSPLVVGVAADADPADVAPSAMTTISPIWMAKS